MPVNAWQTAYGWLCRQRKNAPPGADIWDLRWRWERESEHLYNRVTGGQYRLSPMLIQGRGSKAQAMWSAHDALVLKWVSLQIQHQLPQHEACMHLRGKGVRMSLSEVSEIRRDNRLRFVHRTDVRGYYQHIQKHQVMNQVNRYVTDPVCRDLIQQYVYYSVEDGGDIRTPRAGIPRGCALSPLIGGSLLRHIDGYYRSLNPDEVFYARYMDDFLLLTRTRWQLRRGIARLAEFFDLSGFEHHPEKTQTGRVEKGFDWLGVWFGADGTTLSPRALNNHRERRARLFGQAWLRGMSESETLLRVQAYEARWQRWADGMLLAARGR